MIKKLRTRLIHNVAWRIYHGQVRSHLQRCPGSQIHSSSRSGVAPPFWGPIFAEGCPRAKTQQIFERLLWGHPKFCGLRTAIQRLNHYFAEADLQI